MDKMNIVEKGTVLTVEFRIPGGRGAYHVSLDQVNGSKEAFMAKERGFMVKSYPMLFKNGNDFGEKILAAIWDSQNPPKPEKPVKKVETDETK